MKPASSSRGAIGYVAPFVVFVGIMGLEHSLSIPPQVGYPIRVLVTLAVLLAVSRREIKLRPAQPLASAALGLAVFIIWVAPDALFGYRHHWLFENPVMGKAGGVLPAELQRSVLFLLIRAAGSTLLVPIIEELFWRGWLMRWLINHEFRKIELGTYLPSAFWITALLFASEHGPYWEVGLAAGVIYNWWMTRTKSLADCILAHAVTNGVLAGYVILAGAWQYWL
ncbi:MAG TPA: CAAX prenyl protease-related protein [Bryobacteraceae bacterium]|nr:CAAX prenyl protease-related protein [Bryobacteraceae bacterium]